jgi:hypothetical protein
MPYDTPQGLVLDLIRKVALDWQSQPRGLAEKGQQNEPEHLRESDYRLHLGNADWGVAMDWASAENSASPRGRLVL